MTDRQTLGLWKTIRYRPLHYQLSQHSSECYRVTDLNYSATDSEQPRVTSWQYLAWCAWLQLSPSTPTNLQLDSPQIHECYKTSVYRWCFQHSFLVWQLRQTTTASTDCYITLHSFPSTLYLPLSLCALLLCKLAYIFRVEFGEAREKNHWSESHSLQLKIGPDHHLNT